MRNDLTGLGAGWRPELAMHIERRADLSFIELTAENHFDGIPEAVRCLRRRGIATVVHGIGLSLGGADPPDPARLGFLNSVARAVGAVLVSEHVCFVRANGRESGHLLPLPRTKQCLEVLIENVNLARQALSFPLALENIASLVEWPESEFEEAEFLSSLLEATDTLLLLDVSNLYANAVNHGWNVSRYLDRLPLDRIAYVHVAGGTRKGSLYHDTHAHSVSQPVLDLLRNVCARVNKPAVMLERDDNFPKEDEFNQELDLIARVTNCGAQKEFEAGVRT